LIERINEPKYVASVPEFNRTFYLYLHIPFDIGFKLGNISESTLQMIREALENVDKEKIMIIKKTEIIKPKPLQEIFKAESNISQMVVRINLNDLISNKILETDKSKVNFTDSYINLYDTGIGIGHFKFQFVLDTEISPSRIYQAFLCIFQQLETLERELKPGEKEPSLSNEVRGVITKLRQIGHKTTLNKDTVDDDAIEELFIRKVSSPIFYIYPLFYLPSVENIHKAKEYICLSFLRPENKEVVQHEIESAISYNTQYFANEFLIVKWDAALAGGSSVDEITCESFQNILETCSYIWNSMYIIDGYISNDLKKLTTGHFTLEIEKAKKNLNQIQMLRVEATKIQGIYSDIIVSLWASATQVFEKILTNSWNISGLQKSLQEKIDLLTYLYDYIVDESQNKLNTKISNGLSLLQIMSIPLTIVFALLTWDPESSIWKHYSMEDSSVYWLLSALVLSIIGCLFTYKRYLRLN
jgi:hypothetical protein